MNLFPLIFGKDVCINEKEKVFYGIQNGKTKKNKVPDTINII